ncbi:hypothetical protein Y024_276 [Burkholderia pseudomallei TSV44]|nr:hypothetical protein DP56_1489 [Burkholderia pseudomallei]KGX65400.1 hypothetical protein Y024_276 [Burkholderia pseudomallei TSV44]
MLGPQHVGELLNEIHDEFPLVAIQSIERVRNHRQLVIRSLRSALQQLVYRAIECVTKLLEPMQSRHTSATLPSTDRFLF